ncbi:hypothetical protein [Lyngbya sp. PCC 8106]|uniref:hypothetical protein n=1 Tax=Lyngbya sp. (strain PCC 8106) TaxID=313612 RepID=UPI0000EA9C4F|nr:hypothetical protein [Lyngbya sp. PCC 8106]EAW33317.1 hypothetical protein L8106_09171 [Lyngbya sp. PCC 8106]
MPDPRLIASLIGKLLSASNQEKLAYESKIIELLGGDPVKKVTNLPPRRGKADGGIDGRIKIRAPKITKIQDGEGLLYKKGNPVIQEAGISVKIESKKFSRIQFGGFKDDLERENLYIGVIVSATGLAPDTQRRISDIHQEGIYQFIPLSLGDLLAGNIPNEFICDHNPEKLFRELN